MTTATPGDCQGCDHLAAALLEALKPPPSPPRPLAPYIALALLVGWMMAQYWPLVAKAMR